MRSNGLNGPIDNIVTRPWNVLEWVNCPIANLVTVAQKALEWVNWPHRQSSN